MVTDDKSFLNLAKSFYDNHQCNSLAEFDEDINKISLMNTHFRKYEANGQANYLLLINHFVSFVNCFGIISDSLMQYKLPEHKRKINSLFVLIGHKQFNGDIEIDENFFLALQKAIKER